MMGNPDQFVVMKKASTGSNLTNHHADTDMAALPAHKPAQGHSPLTTQHCHYQYTCCSVVRANSELMV